MFRAYLISLHTLPFIFCGINLLLTKIVFLKGDFKFLSAAGLIYMIFNGFGTLEIGHELYGIATWESFPETVGAFVFQSILLGIIHFVTAICMQRSHNY
jgi:hypothetical protein